MNYQTIQTGLSDYNPTEVSIFLDYCKRLEEGKNSKGEKKAPWFPYVKEDQLIGLYKKVAKDDGLFIDGETITLDKKGEVMVTYNYQAYKNKLLTVYPESLFDLQNVYDGDTFSFKKVSGKVIYEHKFGNPFDLSRKIIGTYCIIKNKRGEFIETLNQDDIQKMRNVAKTQKIWDAWFGEMVLKSVIKRACKRHFKDVTTNMETLDNVNYELENVGISWELTELIEKADTLDELEIVYNENISDCGDEERFLELLKERKLQIKKLAAHENS